MARDDVPLLEREGEGLADAEVDARLANDLLRELGLDSSRRYRLAFLVGALVERGEVEAAAQRHQQRCRCADPERAAGSPDGCRRHDESRHCASTSSRSRPSRCTSETPTASSESRPGPRWPPR